MSDVFDAGQEADKLSLMAKDAIDETRTMHRDQALRRLEEEFLSLNQDERNAVALELENKDHWDSTLPSPSVKLDGEGNVESITFERSTWDSHKRGYERVGVSERQVSFGGDDDMTYDSNIAKQVKSELAKREKQE